MVYWWWRDGIGVRAVGAGRKKDASQEECGIREGVCFIDGEGRRGRKRVSNKDEKREVVVLKEEGDVRKKKTMQRERLSVNEQRIEKGCWAGKSAVEFRDIKTCG